MPIVWDLSDRSFFSDGVWFYGQVQVNNRQIQLTSTKGDGEGGWVAIDDIQISSQSECVTVPEQAVTPTLPPPTTSTQKPGKGII